MNLQKSRGRLHVEKPMSLNSDLLSGHQGQEVEEVKGAEGADNMKGLILSEFKVKYDLLHGQFEEKKKEADGLLYRNKKLQIELLGYNVEYYQKEIGRLRQEVQKFQLENEENKHRLYVAENARNDLQALSKVKKDELKQVLKQLEKEKVTVVELRHQLVEKDRNFTHVLEDLQTSNLKVSGQYDQTNARLCKAESQLKIKGIEVDQLKRQLERKDKQLSQNKQHADKQKEKHELQQYRWNHRLTDLEEDIREYKAKENQAIKNLSTNNQQLERRCASQDVVLVQKQKAVDYAKSLREKQIIIATLEENVRQLEGNKARQDSQLVSLKNKLKGVCDVSLLRESQETQQQMMNDYQTTEKILENRVTELQREVSLAKLSAHGSTASPTKTNTFQELLKNQIEENTQLKAAITSKIQEIFTLKNQLEEQQLKYSILQSEIEILKKKSNAHEKNSRIQFEIEIQNLQNQTESLRRKLQVTETKLGIKVKEVRDKDTFITNVLIGRSKQEDVPFVMAELTRIFEADYSNKLSEASLRIADLQSRLNSH